jgi:hypothetical protein
MQRTRPNDREETVAMAAVEVWEVALWEEEALLLFEEWVSTYDFSLVSYMLLIEDTLQ